jgi:hypothetical protein
MLGMLIDPLCQHLFFKLEGNVCCTQLWFLAYSLKYIGVWNLASKVTYQCKGAFKYKSLWRFNQGNNINGGGTPMECTDSNPGLTGSEEYFKPMYIARKLHTSYSPELRLVSHNKVCHWMGSFMPGYVLSNPGQMSYPDHKQTQECSFTSG